MKKIFAILFTLVLCILTLSLISCNSNNINTDNTQIMMDKHFQVEQENNFTVKSLDAYYYSNVFYYEINDEEFILDVLKDVTLIYVYSGQYYENCFTHSDGEKYHECYYENYLKAVEKGEHIEYSKDEINEFVKVARINNHKS